MEEHHSFSDDALIDLSSKSDEELRSLLEEVLAEEQRLSYRRRILHGKIDILRSEMVSRMSKDRREGRGGITGEDISRLVEVLSSDLRGVSRFDVTADAADDDDQD